MRERQNGQIFENIFGSEFMKRNGLIYFLVLSLILITCNSCGTVKSDAGKTLYIYMCGSNLETKQGLAGKNIGKLLSADISDELNIVIQTGGAKTWRSHGISTDKCQRYTIKDGKLELIEELDDKNMGKSETLSDFLVWGKENYKTSRNMFIFWDHGAGAAKGVCFDENHSFDALTLTEIKDAFSSAGLEQKFELIGFDACLMASLEVAEVMKDHAAYMLASEEIEPGGGWDYKAIAESFAKSDNAEKVGKKACDAFMKKCKASGKDLLATLSLLDLSKTGEMVELFDKSAEYLNEIAGTKTRFSDILDAAKNCEKFGGDNSFTGCSNMVDFYDFINIGIKDDALVDYTHHVLDLFVVRSINSGERKNNGVSMYYPIVYDESEIRDYVALGISEKYNEYLERFYLNVPQKTIEFTDKGRIAEDGAFTVSLSKESQRYLSSIDFLLMETGGNGERSILCTDNDIQHDWENMTFKSNFRGVTVAMKDQGFFYSTLSSNDSYTAFTAPILLNGKSTNLRFYFINDESRQPLGGYYAAAGVWDGFDEHGLPSNEIKTVEEGDTVLFVKKKTLKNGKYQDVYGGEFGVDAILNGLGEAPLDGKLYQYVYVVTDIFGNTFFSDMATFEMTKSYDELLENPLPDGKYAAKVTKIESYETHD